MNKKSGWNNSKKAQQLRVQNPFGDFDKDRVLNYKDCQPYNPYEHGWIGDVWGSIKQRVTTPIYKKVTPYVSRVTTIVPRVVKKYIPEISYERAAERREAVVRVLEKKKEIITERVGEEIKEKIPKREVVISRVAKAIPPIVISKKIIEQAPKIVKHIERARIKVVKPIPEAVGVRVRAILPRTISKVQEIAGYYPEKKKEYKTTISKLKTHQTSLTNLEAEGRKKGWITGEGAESVVTLPTRPRRELQTHQNEGEKLFKEAENAGWVDTKGAINYPDTPKGRAWANKYNNWDKSGRKFVTPDKYYKQEYFEYTPTAKEWWSKYDKKQTEANKLVKKANIYVEEHERIQRARVFGLVGKYEDVETKISPYVKKVVPTWEQIEKESIAHKYGFEPLRRWEAKHIPGAKKFDEFVRGIKIGQLEEIREKPIKGAITTGAFIALPPVFKGVGGIWKGVGGAAALPKVTKITPKAVGAGLGGLYVGVTGLEIKRAPTLEAKGKIVGRTSIELAAMGLGYGVGKRIVPETVEFPGMKGYTWGKGKVFYEAKLPTEKVQIGEIPELRIPKLGLYKFKEKTLQLKWGLPEFKIAKLIPDVPKQVFKGKPYTSALKGKILKGTPKSKSIVSGKKGVLQFHHIVKSGPNEVGVLMTYNEHKAITIAMGQLGKSIGRHTKFYKLFKERKTITSKEINDISKYSKSEQFKKDVDFILTKYKEEMVPGIYEPKTPVESLISLKAKGFGFREPTKIIYPEIATGRLKVVEVKPIHFKEAMNEVLTQHKIPNIEKVTNDLIKLMVKRKVTLYGSTGIRAGGIQLGRVSLARIPRDFDFHLKNTKIANQFKSELIPTVNKAAGKEVLVLKKGHVTVKKSGEKFADIISEEKPIIPYEKGYGEEYIRWGIETEPLVRTDIGFKVPTYSEQMYRKFSAMLISGKYRTMKGTLFKGGKEITIRGKLLPEHKGRMKDIGDYYVGEMARAYKLREMGRIDEAKTIEGILRDRVLAFGDSALTELNRGYKALLKAETAAKLARKEGPLTKIAGTLEEPSILFKGTEYTFRSRLPSKISKVLKYYPYGYIGASKLLSSYKLPREKPSKISAIPSRTLSSLIGVSKITPSPPSKIPSKVPPSKPPYKPPYYSPYYPPSKPPITIIPPLPPPLPHKVVPKKKKKLKKKIPILKYPGFGAFKYTEYTPIATPQQILGGHKLKPKKPVKRSPFPKEPVNVVENLIGK